MPSRRLLVLAIAQGLILPSAHAAVITVNSTADGAPADDGACTLREAIDNANNDSQNGRLSAGECAAGSGADEVVFDAGVFATTQLLQLGREKTTLAGVPTTTITLSQGELAITTPMTITGPGRELLTIDANNLSRHFLIDDGDIDNTFDTTIAGLTLINGEVSGASGGSIDTRENLLLTSSTLRANAALNGGLDRTLASGGALMANASDQHGIHLTLDQVLIENNEARIGGGLAVLGNRVTSPMLVSLDNLEVAGNRTSSPGGVAARAGGAYLDVEGASSVTIFDSTFRENATDSSAGGLELNASGGTSVQLERLQVLDNTAERNIAGMRVNVRASGVDVNARLMDSTISGNRVGSGTSGNTGGLEFYVSESQGEHLIERVTISNNSAGNLYGGADLRAVGAVLRVRNSTISGNTANDDAGGISAYTYDSYANGEPGVIEFEQTTIVGNTADNDNDDDGTGGGLFLNTSSNGTVRLLGSVLANNVDNNTTPQPEFAANGQAYEFVNSLVGDNSGTALSEAPVGSPDGDGNLIGDPNGAGVIDPQLGALADNGGDTLTHLPQTGSPVIDAGGSCSGTDQRGVTRPLGPACDIGSVEVVPANSVDLGIAKVADRDFVTPGDVITYTITVSNAGPSAAVEARVQDSLSASLLNASWTCVASGSASCQSAGSGDIDQLVDVPVGDEVVFTLTAQLDPDGPEVALSNSATVSPPVGFGELNSSDNTATVVTGADLIFADQFVQPVVKAQFAAKAALLDAQRLLPTQLPADGRAKLLLQAHQADGVEPGSAWVHARQRAGHTELRITRLDAGGMLVGQWVKVAPGAVEVQW